MSNFLIDESKLSILVRVKGREIQHGSQHFNLVAVV